MSKTRYEKGLFIMQLGHILDARTRKALASASTPTCNERARSIIVDDKPERKLVTSSAPLADHLPADILEKLQGSQDALPIAFIRDMAHKFGCPDLADMPASELREIIREFVNRPEVCEYSPHKGKEHVSLHPHVSKRRVKSRAVTHGCYRRDQEHQAENIWRSDRTVHKRKGLT